MTGEAIGRGPRGTTSSIGARREARPPGGRIRSPGTLGFILPVLLALSLLSSACGTEPPGEGTPPGENADAGSSGNIDPRVESEEDRPAAGAGGGRNEGAEVSGSGPGDRFEAPPVRAVKRNPPLIITLSLRDGRPFSVADALNGTYDSETILIAWDAKGPAAERPSKDEKDKDKVKDKDKGKGKGDGAEVLDLIDVSEVGEGLARGEDVTFRYDPKALARGPEPSIVEFLEAAPQSLPREETLPLVGSASGARILFAHVREGVLHVLVEMRPSEGAPCSPPDLALSFRDMKSGAAPAVEWRQLKERRRGMRGDTGGPPDASSRRFEAVPLTRDASCAEGGSFHLATAILAPVG